jgi:PST family polysaccharide transporter/lipopolysaccharide exporter
MFVTSPLGNYLAVKQIDGSIIRFIKIIIYPLFASSVMISILYFIDSIVVFKSAILEVVVFVLAGVIIYSLSIFFITRFFKYPILEDINKIIKSIV